MTSDELLEGSDHLYRSIVIIGGGVIGVEFATFYNDLGCEVTVLEGMNRLLPTLDRELGQNLGLILKKRGVKVITGATVEGVEQAKDGLTVRFATKKGTDAVTGEKVLCAIGQQGLLGRSLRRRLHPRERREAPPGGRSLPDLPPPRLRHW